MHFKKLIRVVWQIPLKVFVVIIFALAAYFFGALFLSVFPTFPKQINCKTDYEMFVTTNGIHLDFIFPLENLNEELARQLEIPDAVKYVGFGWGDKDFYINTPQWSDLTFPIAFQALFLKSQTAMHVTFYKNSIPLWDKLDLCPAQNNGLNDYVLQSFAKNADEQNILVDVPGYSTSDKFYLAQGSFSLFRTCNVWVNRGLKIIGVKTSVWSRFDFGVLFHLRN